jgi:hypothetical protein
MAQVVAHGPGQGLAAEDGQCGSQRCGDHDGQRGRDDHQAVRVHARQRH